MSKEISSIQEVIERIQECSSPKAFDDMKHQLEAYMKRTGMGAECISELEKRAFYYVNEYSEKDTSRSIKEAKERVIQYVYEKMAENPEKMIFYLYWKITIIFWKVFWKGNRIKGAAFKRII